MTQSRAGAGLALESLDRLRVGGIVVREEFQGYEAVEASVFGFVDHADATAEFFGDAIMRDGTANERLSRRHEDTLLIRAGVAVNQGGCEQELKCGERALLRIWSVAFEFMEALFQFFEFQFAVEHGEAEGVDDVAGGFAGEAFVGETGVTGSD